MAPEENYTAVEAPSLGKLTDKGAVAANGDIPEYNCIMSPLKRLYGALSIVILAANTITSIQTQAAAAGTYMSSGVSFLRILVSCVLVPLCLTNPPTTPTQTFIPTTGQFPIAGDDIPEGEMDAVIGLGQGTYVWNSATGEFDFMLTKENKPFERSCDHGIVSITTQCGYESNGAYLTMLYLWIIFLAVLFFLKLQASFQFKTNDLRFYLSFDHFATTKLNLRCVLASFALTIASLIALLYYLILTGLPISGALTFTFLNMYLFYSSTTTRWPAFNSGSIRKLDELFPNPIPIRACEPKLANLYGVLMSSETLYDDLLFAMDKSNHQKNDKWLQEYGNATELRNVIAILYGLNDDE